LAAARSTPALLGQENVNDWDNFIESIPWFVDTEAKVHVSKTRNGLQLPSSVSVNFPLFANLLSRSLVTPVSVNDVHYQLVAWDASDGQPFCHDLFAS
jgi:hypothetical protein